MFAQRSPRQLLIFSGFFFACLFFNVSSAHSLTKTIHYHPGGVIHKVYQEVRRTNKTRSRIRIAGRCMSACTLYLTSNKVCVTKTAIFKFHQAQFGHGPRYKARRDPKGSRRLMATYPPNLRKWIKSRGGLPWRGWLTLNAQTAVKHGFAKYC